MPSKNPNKFILGSNLLLYLTPQTVIGKLLAKAPFLNYNKYLPLETVASGNIKI